MNTYFYPTYNQKHFVDKKGGCFTLRSITGKGEECTSNIEITCDNASYEFYFDDLTFTKMSSLINKLKEKYTLPEDYLDKIYFGQREYYDDSKEWVIYFSRPSTEDEILMFKKDVEDKERRRMEAEKELLINLKKYEGNI